MKGIVQYPRILRYWPLIITFALWVVLVLRLFDSHGLRFVISIASVALLIYQWRIYRKTCAGLHLTFLSTVLVSLSVPCFWLALNVVRFYTYDADNPYSTRGWLYFHVIRAQDTILWVGVVLVVLVCVFGVLDVARMAKTRKALE